MYATVRREQQGTNSRLSVSTKYLSSYTFVLQVVLMDYSEGCHEPLWTAAEPCASSHSIYANILNGLEMG